MIRGVRADYSTRFFFAYCGRIFYRDKNRKPLFVDFVR